MRVGVMGTQARDLVNFRGHLLSEVAKAGHCAHGLAPGGTPELTAALTRLGVTFVPIPMNRIGINPVRELWAVWQLWQHLRALKLDLLLTYELKSVVFGTLAATLAGIPRRFAMITGRGTTLQGQAKGLRDRTVRGVVQQLYRLALPRTQGVFFQNQDDCTFFGETGMLRRTVPRKIINGSGVDLDHFPSTPLPTGPVTFLFVGRLLRNKGLRELAEACRLLAQAGLPVRCQVLGPLETNTNGIKASLVTEWVRDGLLEYLGEVADVRPALAAAHVLVLPSYGEGTPRSVLEAMAMGRAVITTDAPGCRDAVEHGLNGLLVPVGDAPALAQAMGFLAADPELVARYGAAGRKRAEAKYDVHLVTAEIMAFMGLDQQGQ
jgi:glycosyltransferase involved in cell wall biosynthesis